MQGMLFYSGTTPEKKAGFTLRDYQQEDADEISRLWESGHRRVLCVHATGLGKSVLAAEMARRRPKGTRAMIVVDASSLATDLYQTVKYHTGETPGLLTGGIKQDLDAEVLVATKQCICAGDKYLEMHFADFSTLIVDECESALANEYLLMLTRIIDSNPSMRLMGMTATPLPAKNRKITDLFSYAAKEPGLLYRDLQWGYLQGWLVKPMQGILQCSMDFSSLKIKRVDGELDYTDKDITRMMLAQGEREWLELAGGIYRISKGKRTIVIVPNSTEVSDKLADYIEGQARDDNRSGVAYSIHVNMDKNQAWNRMRRFKADEFPIAVSCKKFEKGFDYDKVDMVVMARRTKSLRAYCLDSQTEALTPDGWRMGTGLRDGDLVAGFDVASGSVRWERVLSHIVRAPYADEAMMAASGPGIDMRMTDTHRVVYSAPKKGGGWCQWRIATAGDLTGKDSFAVPSSGVQESAGLPLTDWEIRFIGLVMTDGNYNPHNNQISLYQAEGSSVFDRFEKTLSSCGFKFGRHSTKKPSNYGNRKSPLVRWTVSKGRPVCGSPHLRGWGELSAYIPKVSKSWREWENASTGQWAILLEAMHWGNGIKRLKAKWNRCSYSLCFGSLHMAEAVQSLSVRRGWRACLSTFTKNRKNPLYVLHLKNTPRITLSGSRAGRTRLHCVPFDRSEMVWCIEVPSGAFIARRNGKAFITGNTQAAGRGTRPLKEIRDALSGESDSAERMKIIASSRKPSCVIVDCVGVDDEAKDIIGVIDILGRGVRSDIKDRVRGLMLEKARQTMRGVYVPYDVGDLARTAVSDAKEEEERRRQKEAEKAQKAREDRKRALRAAISAAVEPVFRTYECGAEPEGKWAGRWMQVRGRGSSTANQVKLLIAMGVSGRTALSYSKQQAGAVISSYKKKGVTPDWFMVRDWERREGVVE